MRFSRGQAGAPVELVVAVIILLASMAIAVKLISDTGEAQCISQVKGEVDKLKLAMQDLALQSPPSKRTIDFRMPSCGGTSVDVLRFVYYNSPNFCRACSGHFQGCWKLELASMTPDNKIIQNNRLSESSACVDIAGQFTIIDGSGSDPYDPDTTPPSGCLPLGETPCPLNGPSSNLATCPSDVSGVPPTIYNDRNEYGGGAPPSRWASLSRWYTSSPGGNIKPTRLYSITLEKSVASVGGNAEGGAIKICARPVNDR